MAYVHEKCTGCTYAYYCHFNSYFIFSTSCSSNLYIPKTCPLGTKVIDDKFLADLEERKRTETKIVVLSVPKHKEC